MRRAIHLLAILILLSSAAGSAKVKFDFDADADFSEYQIFGVVEPQDGRRSGGRGSPPHLDHQIMNERISNAIKGDLVARGYDIAKPDDADLLVVFRTGREKRWRTGGAGFYGGPRRWRWGYWGGPVHRFPYVTDLLVVDLIDRRSSSLVWRGWVSTSLDNPKKAEKRARKAISRLFDKYPPDES